MVGYWRSLLHSGSASSVSFCLILHSSVARGCVMHKHAYLKDWWNCLDFFIVLAGLVSAMACFSSAVLYALTFTGMYWIWREEGREGGGRKRHFLAKSSFLFHHKDRILF